MHENKIDFNIIVKYNFYFWGAWLLFYSVISYKNIPGIPYYGAVLTSLTITLPLFSLSLFVWPIVRKLQYIRFSRYQLVILHIILANVYTIIWLVIYYGILFAVFGKQLYSFFDVPSTVGWQYPSGITFYLMVAGAYYSVIYYREIKTKEINESHLQLILKETQFKALKNQLNPHFLFNSLNSINALIKSDPDNARSMLVKLSDLLRMSLSYQNNAFVSLQLDLDFVHAYLDIEKIRLADRLEYKETITDSLLNTSIPSMILQPLLENSIKHGIAPSSKKGTVELKIEKCPDFMKIIILNTIATKQDINSYSNIPVNGVGLKNLTNRLEMIYSDNFRISSGKISDNIFKVELDIPYNIEEARN